MVKFGEYKGHKMIILTKNEEDRFPTQFGLGKARIILAHIKEIKQFVEDNEEEQ